MQCAPERPERARHQARPRLHARLVVRTLGVAIRNKSGGHTHSDVSHACRLTLGVGRRTARNPPLEHALLRKVVLQAT